jgi:hypothetical protein
MQKRKEEERPSRKERLEVRQKLSRSKDLLAPGQKVPR